MSERIQYDTQNRVGNPVRLVFEKVYAGEESNSSSSTISILHQWIEEFEIRSTFTSPKNAMEVYKALQSSSTIIYYIQEKEEPRVSVVEEAPSEEGV